LTWKPSLNFRFHESDVCQDVLVGYPLLLTFVFQLAHAGEQFIIGHRPKLFGKRYYIFIGRFHGVLTGYFEEMEQHDRGEARDCFLFSSLLDAFSCAEALFQFGQRRGGGLTSRMRTGLSFFNGPSSYQEQTSGPNKGSLAGALPLLRSFEISN
jgi:hypothetical protein